MNKGDRYKIIKIDEFHPSWYLGEIGEIVSIVHRVVTLKLRCKTYVSVLKDSIEKEIE